MNQYDDTPLSSRTNQALQVLRDLGGETHAVPVDAWRLACSHLMGSPRKSQRFYDARRHLEKRGLVQLRGPDRDQVRITPEEQRPVPRDWWTARGLKRPLDAAPGLVCGVCGTTDRVRQDHVWCGALCLACFWAILYTENAERAATYAETIARYRAGAESRMMS